MNYSLIFRIEYISAGKVVCTRYKSASHETTQTNGLLEDDTVNHIRTAIFIVANATLVRDEVGRDKECMIDETRVELISHCKV